MKVGLVFAGGGGKGAYQIGVWKALRETGFDRQVTAVSGTSVGALNAALFAQGDYETAEETWMDLSPDKMVFSPTQQEAMSFAKQILSPEYIKENYKQLVPLGAVSLASLTVGPAVPLTVIAAGRQGPAALASAVVQWLGSQTLIPFLAARLTHGVITNKGLGKMVDDAIDFSKVAASPVQCWATCCRIFPGFSVERFQLGQRDREYERTVLLASAAIPIVFPSVMLENRIYWDGGIPNLGDNVPVAPLFNSGVYDLILAVHLSDDKRPQTEKFPQANILDIYPSEDLGGTAGTFDFTRKGAVERIELGYQDGLDVLEKL